MPRTISQEFSERYAFTRIDLVIDTHGNATLTFTAKSAAHYQFLLDLILPDNFNEQALSVSLVLQAKHAEKTLHELLIKLNRVFDINDELIQVELFTTAIKSPLTDNIRVKAKARSQAEIPACFNSKHVSQVKTISAEKASSLCYKTAKLSFDDKDVRHIDMTSSIDGCFSIAIYFKTPQEGEFIKDIFKKPYPKGISYGLNDYYDLSFEFYLKRDNKELFIKYFTEKFGIIDSQYAIRSLDFFKKNFAEYLDDYAHGFPGGNMYLRNREPEVVSQPCDCNQKIRENFGSYEDVITRAVLHYDDVALLALLQIRNGANTYYLDMPLLAVAATFWSIRNLPTAEIDKLHQKIIACVTLLVRYGADPMLKASSTTTEELIAWEHENTDERAKIIYAEIIKILKASPLSIPHITKQHPKFKGDPISSTIQKGNEFLLRKPRTPHIENVRILPATSNAYLAFDMYDGTVITLETKPQDQLTKIEKKLFEDLFCATFKLKSTDKEESIKKYFKEQIVESEEDNSKAYVDILRINGKICGFNLYEVVTFPEFTVNYVKLALKSKELQYSGVMQIISHTPSFMLKIINPKRKIYTYYEAIESGNMAQQPTLDFYPKGHTAKRDAEKIADDFNESHLITKKDDIIYVKDELALKKPVSLDALKAKPFKTTEELERLECDRILKQEQESTVAIAYEVTPSNLEKFSRIVKPHLKSLTYPEVVKRYAQAHPFLQKQDHGYKRLSTLCRHFSSFLKPPSSTLTPPTPPISTNQHTATIS